MTAWHRSWRADVGLRVSGLSLCTLSGAAIAQLWAMPVQPGGTAALPYVLAGVGYVGASAGVTLTVLGRRLLDPGAVSGRWRRQMAAEPRVREPMPLPSWQACSTWPDGVAEARRCLARPFGSEAYRTSITTTADA